ncbi:MAG TPA: peptidoglycan-binding domain-containing protein, partial [Gemmatimonadota bacterium]|nr:peptidoglycan-binding domain-containing protein [Gemmatimonadota bacterium]
PAEIARLQHALAAAGFDPGRATGQWNATTRLELGRFQASRGLLQCECVTYETLVVLRIHPQVVASISAPLDGGYGSRTVVLVPGHDRHLGLGHHSGVIVGHGASVIVGHQPARGAGEFARDRHFRDRKPHFRDRGHDRDPHFDPRPPRPRPGSSISGSGAPLRSLTPRQTQPRTPAARPDSR